MKQLYIHPVTHVSPIHPIAILMTSGGGDMNINTTDKVTSEYDVF